MGQTLLETNLKELISSIVIDNFLDLLNAHNFLKGLADSTQSKQW